MIEKHVFDVFQLAFLKSCKNTKRVAANNPEPTENFLGDFIIILQKLSQQEPQGVLACLNQQTLKLLNEIVASNGTLTPQNTQLQ